MTADKEAILAKCDELLRFLAENDRHDKLRRLAADIASYREHVQSELEAERNEGRNA